MTKTPIQWAIEPLKKYAQFTGRSQRAEYWWFALFVAISTVIANIIDVLLKTNKLGAGLVSGLLSLALLIPNLSVSVRRLHDIDRTGWWLVAPIIIGAFLVLIAVSVVR